MKSVFAWMGRGVSGRLSWGRRFALAGLLGLAVPAAARADILVIAPHPDDEIIMASGVIQRALARGETVYVVYVTNGDYAGPSLGTLRQGEAVAGQAALGLPEDRLIFLGYPDGKVFEIWDRYRYPWDFPDPDAPLVTHNNISATYASRGLGRMDYHRYRFGVPGSYRWETMIGDMADLLVNLRPSHIFTTSQWDTHLDHEATFFLLQAGVLQATAAVPGYNPTIHKTTIWPGDTSWPAPPNPTAYFTEIPKPAFTNRWGANPLTWPERESLDVPLAMQSTLSSTNPKYNAIVAHASQGGIEEYIGRWLHKDEFFWTEMFSGTNRPPVPNAGLGQQAPENTVVTLDARASADPDGTPLTYAWRQVGGPPVVISNPNAAQPTFLAPGGLTTNVILEFELVVSDGELTSVPDAVTITAVSSTPPPSYGPNLASLAVITASSERPATGQTADKVADGFAQGYPTDATREWATGGQGAGAWLSMTWAQPVAIAKIVLFDRPNTGDQMTAGVLTFSDGSTLAVGPLTNTGEGVEYAFAPRTVTSVRLDVTQVSATTGNVGLAEFEVYEVGGINHPPVANAGPDRTVGAGEAASLDGSMSRDTNGDPLSFSWTQMAGAAVALSNPSSATPSFIAPAATPGRQTLTFRLVVSDAEFTSQPDTVDILIPGSVNSPPVASAGPDRTVSAGVSVTLAGSGTDPEGQPISFQWVQTQGTPVALASTSSANLTFTVPADAADQTLTFELVVNDGERSSSPDSVNVNVVALPPAASNIAPGAAVTASTQRAPTQAAAKAVDGQAVGYPVDGSREWATVNQRNGAWIELRWPVAYIINRVRLHDRPNVSDHILSGTLTFSDGTSLSVGALNNDGTATDVLVSPRRVRWVRFTVDSTSAGTMNAGLSEVLVFQQTGTLAEQPPLASAGPDQTVAGGSAVELDGSASYDPEGHPVTFLWTQTGGTPVTLSDSTAAIVSFVAPPQQLDPQPLTFQLVVSDGVTNGDPDIVVVTVAGQPNLALLATASASSAASTTQGPAKANDGIIDGYPTNSAAEWASNRERAGAWLQLTWSVDQTINRIRLYDRPNPNDHITAATLLFSDGSSVPVGTLPNNGGRLEVTFDARTVRWVRLRVDAVSAATGRVGLAEIEVYPLPQ